MQAGAAQSPVPVEEEEEPSVRTYGLPEPGEPADETEYDPNN
jgi:hypothetical protein